MAEKVVIFEADIKIDEAIKAQQDLTAEIEKQKKKLDELKQSNTDNSEAVIKQTALIKVLVKEQKANEAQLQAVIKSNSGSKKNVVKKTSAKAGKCLKRNVNALAMILKFL